MKHVRQRYRRCGAACVAMLAGVDLDLATYVHGDRQASPLSIGRALWRLGYHYGRHFALKGVLPPAGARGLLVMQTAKRSTLGHVAALDGRGRVMDPMLPGPVAIDDYPAALLRRGQLLTPCAWIEVRRRRVG